MAAPKRSKAQREKDLETTAALYLRGWTQRRIAAHVGVSREQIAYDLAAIRSQWLQSAVMDFSEAKSRELARLDHLEEVAWDAWERSCVRFGRDGRRLATAGPGDPRFLSQVASCIERRCRILGLNAPDVTEAVISVRRPLIELSDDELLAAGHTNDDRGT